MSLLVADCPRCGAKRITFDVEGQHHFDTRAGWQNCFEIFCVCRHCKRSTVFVVALGNNATAKFHLNQSNGLVAFEGAFNEHVEIEGFVSVRDNLSVEAPEHVEGEPTLRVDHVPSLLGRRAFLRLSRGV